MGGRKLFSPIRGLSTRMCIRNVKSFPESVYGSFHVVAVNTRIKQMSRFSQTSTDFS